MEDHVAVLREDYVTTMWIQGQLRRYSLRLIVSALTRMCVRTGVAPHRKDKGGEAVPPKELREVPARNYCPKRTQVVVPLLDL